MANQSQIVLALSGVAAAHYLKYIGASRGKWDLRLVISTKGRQLLAGGGKQRDHSVGIRRESAGVHQGQRENLVRGRLKRVLIGLAAETMDPDIRSPHDKAPFATLISTGCASLEIALSLTTS